MESQVPVSSNTKRGGNKLWLIVGGAILACCCGAAMIAGAAGWFLYTSSSQTTTTSNPVPVSTTPASVAPASPQLEWLVTAGEMNSISNDIGIVQWELADATPGEYRVCHTFTGTSWSVNPNQASNCIFQHTPGNSLNNIVKSMFEAGQLFPDEVPVEASFDFNGEYALYAGTFPSNAHAVFDLLLLQGDYLYWSSVTLGSPAGVTPVEIYQSSPEIIQGFLERIIRINLERSK